MVANVVYIDEDDLAVPALTADEQKWVTQAGKLFAAMPPRLRLMESAGVIQVVDAEGARQSACCDGAAGRDRIVLAEIISAASKIFGVSG